MVKLVAVTACPLAARIVAEGEEFEVDEKVAKVLVALGRARRKELGNGQTLHVRREYKRRDMKAEN